MQTLFLAQLSQAYLTQKDAGQHWQLIYENRRNIPPNQLRRTQNLSFSQRPTSGSVCSWAQKIGPWGIWLYQHRQ